MSKNKLLSILKAPKPTKNERKIFLNQKQKKTLYKSIKKWDRKNPPKSKIEETKRILFKSRKSIFKLKNYYDNKSDCIKCKALTDIRTVL